jgi:hypothetical protein
MVKWFKTGASALAAAALMGGAVQACAALETAAAPADVKPALWKVADSDTTIYLFGTIHVLPEGRAWMTPALEAAVDGADELVTEIGALETAGAQGGAAMKELGMSKGLKPLAQRVPAEKRAALAELVAASGLPAQALDGMETWLAGILLFQATMTRLGVAPESGVEWQLAERWQDSGKPVLGLETLREQFGIFDRLPEGTQQAFLVSTLEDPAEMKQQFGAMLDAWARGDVEGVARTFNDEEQMPKALRKVLLDARNVRWTEWLAKRMDRPGTVFVAVGAGHLAGDQSVRAMLKKKGFKATRVQ